MNLHNLIIYCFSLWACSKICCQRCSCSGVWHLDGLRDSSFPGAKRLDCRRALAGRTEGRPYICATLWQRLSTDGGVSGVVINVAKSPSWRHPHTRCGDDVQWVPTRATKSRMRQKTRWGHVQCSCQSNQSAIALPNPSWLTSALYVAPPAIFVASRVLSHMWALS